MTGAFGVLLGDQVDRGLAVGRGGRGEDQAPDVVRAHRVEQVQRADHVPAPVALGVLDGLAHERERGEVQDAVEPAREHGVERGRVQQVGLDEGRALRDRLAVAAVERVEHGDLVAARDELLRDDRADVAGSAGDEEAHAG